MVVPGRDMLRTLASETGGRAIVGGNDLRNALEQVAHDASAYYLIAYESPHGDDGKFHRLTVRVKRPRAAVFARPGYFAFKRGQGGPETTSTPSSVLPAVQQALNRLADSLRPDGDEPTGSRRRATIPTETPSPAPLPLMLAPMTVAVARGRTIGEPLTRREFRRTDTLVFRGVTTGTPAVAARLLDRFGRRLTDLPVVSTAGSAELTLALGNLGAGDYVIEFSAAADGTEAQQYVGFRVVR
jgi:hypothetical protein